jgi:hypothetical protein
LQIRSSERIRRIGMHTKLCDSCCCFGVIGDSDSVMGSEGGSEIKAAHEDDERGNEKKGKRM